MVSDTKECRFFRIHPRLRLRETEPVLASRHVPFLRWHSSSAASGTCHSHSTHLSSILQLRLSASLHRWSDITTPPRQRSDLLRQRSDVSVLPRWNPVSAPLRYLSLFSAPPRFTGLSASDGGVRWFAPVHQSAPEPPLPRALSHIEPPIVAARAPVRCRLKNLTRARLAGQGVPFLSEPGRGGGGAEGGVFDGGLSDGLAGGGGGGGGLKLFRVRSGWSETEEGRSRCSSCEYIFYVAYFYGDSRLFPLIHRAVLASVYYGLSGLTPI